MEPMIRSSSRQDEALGADLAAAGFAFVLAAPMRELLLACGAVVRLGAEFAASWDDLPVDEVHGRPGSLSPPPDMPVCRRAPAAAWGAVPHQPHFQAVDYNPLNGGVERWFQPICRRSAAARLSRRSCDFCRNIFGARASPGDRAGGSKRTSSGSRPWRRLPPADPGRHASRWRRLRARAALRRRNIDQGTT